jgi:hypothetical protein
MMVSVSQTVAKELERYKRGIRRLAKAFSDHLIIGGYPKELRGNTVSHLEAYALKEKEQEAKNDR